MDLALTPGLLEHNHFSSARRRHIHNHIAILSRSLISFCFVGVRRWYQRAGTVRNHAGSISYLKYVPGEKRLLLVEEAPPTATCHLPVCKWSLPLLQRLNILQPAWHHRHSEISALWTVFSLFGFIQMQHQRERFCSALAYASERD